jgi:hypothetical protein
MNLTLELLGVCVCVWTLELLGVTLTLCALLHLSVFPFLLFFV